MKTFISVIAFSTFSIFFQESAFASGKQCLDKVKLAYINVGFVDGSVASADEGNGIYIGYYSRSGEIIKAGVNGYLNLNDGPRGFALYQSLNTALALGLKVSAWDHDRTPGGYGTCDDFDEVRLSY